MIPWAWLQLLATCCFTLLAVKAVTVVVKWWLHRRRLYSLVPEPCKGHWLRGHLPADPLKAKEVYISYVRKLPRMFIRQMGPVITGISVCHPDTIAEAMRRNWPNSPLADLVFKPWLGNGLVFSAGKRWERDRRMLAQVFVPSMRREYVGAFKDACGTMLNLWEARLELGVNVSEFFPSMTFDVILQCAMGAETSCQTETNKNAPVMQYSAAMETIVGILMTRFYSPWYYIDFVFWNAPIGRRLRKALDVTSQFSDKLIKDRRALLERKSADSDSSPDTQRRQDMLDILLTVTDEEGVGMSDIEIREQVDTFLFAGHDTTSSSLQWAAHYLSEHQDVQDQCREEIEGVLSECGGLDNFKHEHIGKLVYLTQTIQEILRASSVVGIVGRKTTDDLVIDEVALPANTEISVNIVGVHHNEQVWSDPHTFDPDRFAPERGSRSPAAFIPFGVGARSCIAKHFAMDEMKVVLSMVLHKFRLLPDPNAPKPVWKMAMIVKPFPAAKVLIELL